MPRVRDKALVVFFVLCLIGSTGCAADESSDAGASATEATTAPSEAETLADFFGWEEMTPEDQAAEEEKWRQRDREMQQKIAECMAEQGFEYQPVIWEEEYSFAGPLDEEELTEEEWKLKYGYGHFAMMLEDMRRWEEEGPPEEEFRDPNQEYVESLSESEQEAYFKALEGDWEGHMPEPEFDEEGNEIWVEPDWEAIGGCRTMVEQEYYGAQNEAMEQLWQELDPAWREFEQWVNSDPRVVELRRAWSACMSEKGYDFEDEESIWRYLEGLNEELWTANEPPPDWEPTEEELEDMGPFGPGITEEDIQELADEELAIAAADVECAGGMYEEIDEIRVGYEARFIEKYRDLLERERDLIQDM